jgi:hypothetical protein
MFRPRVRPPGRKAKAVDVVAPNDVYAASVTILAEVLVGRHPTGGVFKEYNVATVTRDCEGRHDLATDGLGELVAGALLVFEAYLVLAGLALLLTAAQAPIRRGRWLLVMFSASPVVES